MITLRLDGFGADVQLEQDGKTLHKYLSYQKLQQLILKDFVMDSGPLPLGTIAYRRTGQGGEAIALVEPASRRSVQFAQTEKKNGQESTRLLTFTIPLPSLLWIHELDVSKRLSETRVFALKQMWVLPSTKVFHAPLSNTDPAGKVCWGEGQELLTQPFNTLAGLGSLPRLYFHQPFSKDLDYGWKSHAKELPAALSFFRQYHGKPVFPMNKLIPFQTFAEVWGQRQGGAS